MTTTTAAPRRLSPTRRRRRRRPPHPHPRRARRGAPAARAGAARAGAARAGTGRAGAARPRPLGVWKCLWRQGHARNAHDARRARRARARHAGGGGRQGGIFGGEAEVIAAFFTRSHERTPLMPSDGAPVHLRKEKYILVADAASFQVASGASFGLPAQTYVQLYHLGKHEADGVRFGYAKEEGIFKHPAIDVGGLDQPAPEARRACRLRGAVDVVGPARAMTSRTWRARSRPSGTSWRWRRSSRRRRAIS